MARTIDKLHFIVNSVRREIDKDTRYTGLSGPKRIIIQHLGDVKDEVVHEKDIVNWFNLRKSTITELLTVLENEGYITKTVSPIDARYRVVKLTSLGQEVYESGVHIIDNVDKKTTENLSAEEIETLHSLLDKLIGDKR